MVGIVDFDYLPKWLWFYTADNDQLLVLQEKLGLNRLF